MSDNNYMSDVVHDLNMRNSDFVELTDGRDPFIYRKLEDDAFGGKHFIGSYVLISYQTTRISVLDYTTLLVLERIIKTILVRTILT